jgi:site-specific recombinase XerD
MSKQNSHNSKNSHTQITMIEYKKYLELIGYKKATIKYLSSIAKEYQEYTQNKTCTPLEYMSYLEHRKNKNNPSKTLSNSNLNTHIYGLKKYFEYLEKVEKRIVIAPFLNYKVTPNSIDYLTIQEIKTLFKKAETLREKAILSCLYHLGLRASEASNLKIEDIDLKNNIAFISKTKTGHQRQIPINTTAQEILKKYINNREKGHLLLGLKGNLKSDAILGIVKKIARSTSIKKRVYAHLLRHSIATHLLNNGMELEKVSLFLGHKSLESTQRYTHII